MLKVTKRLYISWIICYCGFALRPSIVYCKQSYWQKIGIFRRSAVLINRLNHNISLCFYVFGHSLCWSEKLFCLEDVGILPSARMKICILSTFTAYGKVGVNQKLFGRYELLLKDQNPRKWKKKSLKVQNFEVVNSAICAIFTLCHCKNLAVGCWSDFPPEKFYFEIFWKTNAVSIYFWTKIYSWAKFNGNWFSDPKRSGRVLGRLPLNCICNQILQKQTAGYNCSVCMTDPLNVRLRAAEIWFAQLKERKPLMVIES